MEKHKKLVRVVCLVLAALMVMTIGVPLIFAYAETPAEKLERLRKELEDIPHEHGHIRCDCITDAVGQARVGFIYIVNANLVAFMTAAFKEYTSETLKKQKRESVRQKLEKVKEELSNHRQLKKEKKREQEPIR